MGEFLIDLHQLIVLIGQTFESSLVALEFDKNLVDLVGVDHFFIERFQLKFEVLHVLGGILLTSEDSHFLFQRQILCEKHIDYCVQIVHVDLEVFEQTGPV